MADCESTNSRGAAYSLRDFSEAFTREEIEEHHEQARRTCAATLKLHEDSTWEEIRIAFYAEYHKRYCTAA